MLDISKKINYNHDGVGLSPPATSAVADIKWTFVPGTGGLRVDRS